MAATNFKTENNTFRKLIGNGMTYRIPRFQRDYSWDTEEWEDLWEDLMGTIGPSEDPAHYMGYLVLQSDDDKTFDVIDGQQRLTTLSLIVLAALKNLQRLIRAGQDATANERRVEQLRQTYIGFLDPVTLVARPKLMLNRNNNNYYQNHLVPLGHLPQRGLRASEHRLRKAFEWFEKRIGEHLRRGSEDHGVQIAKMIENMSDRLFFTVITVGDELNAYKVFETLNSRGVRLSVTDLLKNYLFSVIDRASRSDHDLQNLEDRWENIVGRLQSENFPDFFRVHWNSRHNLTRQSDLFKAVRGGVRTPEAAFALLRDLETDLDTYLALVSPEGSDWRPEDKKLANTLKRFRVKQPYPLLLAAWRVFDPEDFTGLLRATVVISLRYNVIGGLSPGEQERAYNEAAEQIARGQKSRLGDILPLLKSVYPDDASFRAVFAEKSLRTSDARNKQVVRFILCAIEKHLSGHEVDPLNDTHTIEHVLPQNAPDGWGGINADEISALSSRLGNMTLLEASANRDLGTQEYPEKRPIYQNSGFHLTRRLAEHYSAWTPERIASHQAWMADQATAIWRIAQLSP